MGVWKRDTGWTIRHWNNGCIIDHCRISGFIATGCGRFFNAVSSMKRGVIIAKRDTLLHNQWLRYCYETGFGSNVFNLFLPLPFFFCNLRFMAIMGLVFGKFPLVFLFHFCLFVSLIPFLGGEYLMTKPPYIIYRTVRYTLIWSWKRTGVIHNDAEAD